MDFPTTEAEIIALADTMYAGFGRHPGNFPNVNRGMLRVRRLLYQNASNAQIYAISQAQLATAAKNASLDALRNVMMHCLRKSEVDVADEPEKLAEIGWGPRAMPQPVQTPGEPKNLIAAKQGKTTLQLRWDRPQSTTEVRNYIVERRQLQNGTTFSSWAVIGTAIDNEITLTRQPRGTYLEYRIKAINTAGESTPSNTVSVTL